MCWIGKYNFKKAEEDIPIFKIMSIKNKKLSSIYQNYPYELNQKIKSEIQIDSWIDKDTCRVFKALHSYSNDITIEELFFSKHYLDYFLLSLKDTVRRVDGIIPKGALYCINSAGECISTAIILKNIIY